MLAHAAARLGWSDWSLDPTVVVGLAAVVAAYLWAWRRGWLRSDDDVGPWVGRGGGRWRPWLFAGGVLSALVALQSPLDAGGDRYLLSLHMLQHLLLMMVAPPLVLLGLCGMCPARARGPSPLGAAGRWLIRPWPATVLFNLVLLVWHLPVLYDATLRTPPIHVVEHASFVAVGVLFWWPIVDPLRQRDGPAVGPFTKIAMLVLAGIPPTILGFVFAMGRPFYDFYVRAPRLWGASAVVDQQWAGVIMLGLGNVVYFVAISAIFLRLFTDPAVDEAEGDLSPASPVGSLHGC